MQYANKNSLNSLHAFVIYQSIRCRFAEIGAFTLYHQRQVILLPYLIDSISTYSDSFRINGYKFTERVSVRG